MHKALIICKREYLSTVRTKAFLISILLMPTLMIGAVFLQILVEDHGAQEARKIVVFDGTNQIFDRLARRPEPIDTGAAQPIFIKAPRCIPTNQDRLEFSQMIRSGQIAGFLEIAPNCIDPDAPEAPEGGITFIAQNVAFDTLGPNLKRQVVDSVMEIRLERLGLNNDRVRAAIRPVPFEALTPYTPSKTGEITRSDPVRSAIASILPLGFLLLIFMSVMVSAQPMLQSVIEEKQLKIAELLLASIRPSTLMMGKLLGNAAIAVSIMGIYLLGGAILAVYFLYTDLVSWQLLGWFVIFELLAVSMYGSVFLAVGAACNELRDTQSLLAPVLIFAVAPVMLWSSAVSDPMGALATGLSLFPLTAPQMMMVRLAATDAVPVWQIAASVLSSGAGTALGIFTAGKVLKTGLLWRGKTPKLTQLLSWIRQ